MPESFVTAEVQTSRDWIRELAGDRPDWALGPGCDLEEFADARGGSVDRLERLFVYSDGTLTRVLAAYFNEAIDAVASSAHLPCWVANAGALETLCGVEKTRSVMLFGRASKTPIMRATSWLDYDRVDGLREAIAREPAGLGQALMNLRIPYLKTLLFWGRPAPGGEIARATIMEYRGAPFALVQEVLLASTSRTDRPVAPQRFASLGPAPSRK